MPDWLSVVLLGIVEGVTEFLPISSTGHLLLLQNTGLLAPRSDLFNVVIQSGAVLAVIAAFRERCVSLVTRFSEPEPRDYASKLLVAFAVTGVFGVGLKALDFELPETAAPVAWATLLGGLAILVVERRLRHASAPDTITWTVALAVAFAQLLAATLPGTSRSGACIVVAMLFGSSRRSATEFSFLVGVPTLLAAGGLQTVGALRDGTAASEDWALLGLGTLVSAVMAFVVVKWLLRFVQTHTLNVFGYYRIALGALIFATLSWMGSSAPQ